MARPRSVAMAWYRAEDYRELLGVVADADKLPANYEAWRVSAEQVAGEVSRSGVQVIRVELRPEPFKGWCDLNGVLADGRARARYATEQAPNGDTSVPDPE